MTIEQVMLPGNAIYITCFVLFCAYHLIVHGSELYTDVVEGVLLAWFIGWLFLNLLLWLWFQSLLVWGVGQ